MSSIISPYLLTKKAETLAGGFISHEDIADNVVTHEEMAKAGNWKEEFDGFYRVGSATRLNMLAIRVSILKKRIEQQRIVLTTTQAALDRNEALLAEARAEIEEFAK